MLDLILPGFVYTLSMSKTRRHPLQMQEWFRRPSQVRRMQQNNGYLKAHVTTSCWIKGKLDGI